MRCTTETIKVIIEEGDAAFIICPFCLETRKLSVGQNSGVTKRALKVKCCCNNVLKICLEYRKHPRKATNLLGHSINLTNQNERQDIIIENISLGGIAFCPFKKQQIRREDLLEVSFNLNDVRQTPIVTHVTVRTATDNYIGCEFNTVDKLATSLKSFLKT
jgi:hypothetical protein